MSVENENISVDVEGGSRSGRLARNTLYLYGQMLVQLVVSLYTARVVLDTLGQSDYGIFSVVGGVMSVFLTLNTIESATMRFVIYEQGRGADKARKHMVFSTAQSVHLAIAGIVLLLAETVGLYYVCNYLNVPPARLPATIVVYEFYVFGALTGILCAPFDALIVAHERMGVFASIGIYNVLANLLIVFLVQYAEVDKLILYAGLVILVQVSMRVIYAWYCYVQFPETRGRWCFDRQLFVRMLKFGGWLFNGTLAVTGYTQGINLLFNYFYGTLLNAAFGIAFAVQNKVSSFADNLLVAARPQMVKSYAAGDWQYLHKLIFNTSRIAALLLFLISLPIMLETHFVLFVWLGEDLPQYTVWFVRLSLMMIIVQAMGQVMCITVHATGRIARFQMIESNMLLLIVPIAAWLLWKGYSPIVVYVAQLIVFILTHVVRVLIVCPMVELPVWRYVREVVLRTLGVMILGSILPVLVHQYGGMHSYPLSQVLVVSVVSLLSVGASIYWLGCDSEGRSLIHAKASKIVKSLIATRG